MPGKQDHKIQELFQRIRDRKAQLKTLPIELKGLITLKDLNQIYDYLLENQDTIAKKLAAGKPYRLDKTYSELPRTLNFIIDIQGNIALILETKRKNALNKKNPQTKVFAGTFKTTKASWRIDTEILQKIANSVFYVDKDAPISDAKKEAMAAQLVAQNNQENDCFVNAPVLGPVINESGIRMPENMKYTKKQSFYSNWANYGSLDRFLQTPEGQALTDTQLDRMVNQLIVSIKSVHDAKMIHQDIKKDNILVFKDENGNYRLELADFGKVYVDGTKTTVNSEVHSTRQYESPEIAALNKDPDAAWHDHFYDKKIKSYGRDLGQKMPVKSDYSEPHRANDMWALGILIFELYHKKMPTAADQGQFSGLLSGLLQPSRAKRFTADEALDFILNQQTEANISDAKSREAQAQQAISETMAFLGTNKAKANHAGYRPSRTTRSTPSKKITQHTIVDSIRVKRTRVR